MANKVTGKELKAKSKETKEVVAKEATTMEELLATSGYTLSVPKKGETLKGLVTNVNRKMERVDIGAKTEGVY